MDQKRVAAATIVATVAASVARYTPGLVLERWTQGLIDGAAAAPFGTVGETVLLASNAVNVVEVTASLAIGVGFGLFLTKRVPNVADALRTVTKTGLGVVGVATVGGFLFGGLDPVYAVALGAPAVSVCLLVVVGAVAGAGAVEFGLLGDDGGETADTIDPAMEPSDDDQTNGSGA